ncbi:hypothetical protein QJS04_geneDACA017821 [Acorus gramineus]|uniref:Uncharacterized protein n=1 Tax=Acorus gramineus TaxID=55184 RepID=A0AAV9A3F3_ACOGR|nr:hypothetical protein QJS04_geneDACA017821 [Acorus gramineus]
METIRCCISCILPCGALDVVRIVHSNGRVEELTGTVLAGDVMQTHPKHVLRKLPSPSDASKGGSGITQILSPHAELQHGKIYFLLPVASAEKSHQRKINNAKASKKKRLSESVSDRYLSEILLEKASPNQRERRRGRVGVWRPHLESISEASSEAGFND